MNKNNQSAASQFPKIYRFITEKIKNVQRDLKILILGVVFGVLAILIVLLGLYLAIDLRGKKEIDKQRATISSQIGYWEKVVVKKKGYRDGYFMLAVLEYQLREFDKSKEYLGKVLSIDPNFSPAQDFQKVLSANWRKGE
ncbi:MAG: hypothetical protein HYU48_00925 [Candidatus Levybacteria bacterium]|nr:hypothetical protein [Candidatus Levybacteria bacterium]